MQIMKKIALLFLFVLLGVEGSTTGLCKYCKYAAFCDECVKCPCTWSPSTPNCEYCSYCKYCSLAKACSLCEAGGLVDYFDSAVASVSASLPDSVRNLFSSSEATELDTMAKTDRAVIDEHLAKLRFTDEQKKKMESKGEL